MRRLASEFRSAHCGSRGPTAHVDVEYVNSISSPGRLSMVWIFDVGEMADGLTVDTRR